MQRPVILAGMLGAAAGAPYVIDQSDELQSQWQSIVAPPAVTTMQPISAQPSPFAMQGMPVSGMPMSGMPVSEMKVPEMPVPSSPGDHLYRSPAPLEGIPTYSLAEVLRMDVSKEWVYSRWARKSTGLAEPELFGIRVPLVSGTRMTDVAGSLTYYFNICGRVEKIRLTGKTANTSELVNVVASRYGLRPAPPLVAGEQLYRVESNGRVESELRTQPDSVLWTTSPHDSFMVHLEINRRGSGRYVVRPLPQLEALQPPPGAAPAARAATTAASRATCFSWRVGGAVHRPSSGPAGVDKYGGPRNGSPQEGSPFAP